MVTIKSFKVTNIDDLVFNKVEHTQFIYRLIKHLIKVYEDIEDLDAETMDNYSNLNYDKRQTQKRLYRIKRDFEKEEENYKEYTEEETKSILKDINAVLEYDEEFEY